MNVVTNQEDEDVSTLQTEASVSSGDGGSSGNSESKWRRKYVSDKNIERVIEKHKKSEREAKLNTGLKEAFDILNYLSEIKKKNTQNKK